MDKADLSHADLRGVDLRNTELRWANLYRADLRNARLTNSGFLGANFSKANIVGAEFSEEVIKYLEKRGDISGVKVCLKITKEVISYKEYCIRRQEKEC